MSATMHLPARSWASAHRALLSAFALALALAILITAALVLTRTVGDEIARPGTGVKHASATTIRPTFPKENCSRGFCAR